MKHALFYLCFFAHTTFVLPSNYPPTIDVFEGNKSLPVFVLEHKAPPIDLSSSSTPLHKRHAPDDIREHLNQQYHCDNEYHLAQNLLNNHCACADWNAATFLYSMACLFGKPLSSGYLHKQPMHLLCTYKGVTYGFSDASLDIIMQQWKLYDYDAFWDVIKQFPNYQERIADCQQLIEQDKTIAKKVSKKANVRIAQESKPTLDERKRHQQAQAFLLQQKALKKLIEFVKERYEQQQVKKNFNQQKRIIEQELQESSELLAFCQSHGCGDHKRFARRIATLQDMQQNGIVYTDNVYTLNQAAQTEFDALQFNSKNFTSCYGNQLQHVVHQDCIVLAQQIAETPSSSTLFAYKTPLYQLTSAACDFNKAGETFKAIAITDLCWAFIDCAKAAVEGAALGVAGALQDIIDHPLETVICLAAGEYVLAFQLAKVAFHVADIGITYAIDPQAGKDKWHEYIAPVNALITAITHNQITLRDAIKGGVQLTVHLRTQGKLLSGLGKLGRVARSKAFEFVKNNPLATPEAYLVTAEGAVLKSFSTLSKRESDSFAGKLPNKSEVSSAISIKKLMKKEQLPTKGKIRYVPPKKLHASQGLPRVKLCDNRRGYIDRFDNIWVKGESRTKGQAFEWDVQLSEQGKQQLGWMTRDNMHLNVSLDGKVTHK